MRFVSTAVRAPGVSFIEAMRQGLAPDGGLYMPSNIPKLKWLGDGSLKQMPFTEIAAGMARPFLQDDLSDEAIRSIVEDAFSFPLELAEIGGDIRVLELFHGPTLAFKDFGARFMARLFAEDAAGQGEKVTILVATSGDTGSAVASGFYDVPGVDVMVLFPKGKVSPLQRKQMATLGKNITTLEIDGVFDDCQRLVKQAFSDPVLQGAMKLSSANSINIARLLPQSFYYAWAVSRLEADTEPIFVTPSGNFGNLTAGLLAHRMGLPVKHFVAATNRNDVVPRFLEGSSYSPASSVQTISNAMDVGEPSNFVRMMHLVDGDSDRLRKEINGYAFSDEETREMIEVVFHESGYLICPHTAVGVLAARADLKKKSHDHPVVVLGTAHPVKFRETVEPLTGKKVDVPQTLIKMLQKEESSLPMGREFPEFRDYLLSRTS